ncbi:ATP-dependent helicase HrpB [Dinoroseobacter sp. PD6]|uniref:ATP-dependent helicase HrpB n=1 Tax=Dinoroseobacter sp. PD6 TaxID=3028384 RepID=UPI00237A328E|nr:ATP-dependent helicase HrpB [Dinoroseobacter sp. PD6]MDD9717723.1 ATP-dependent helicase HrpB [Dinoroseobacter sp. PD6]
MLRPWREYVRNNEAVGVTSGGGKSASLPIDGALPELLAAMAGSGMAVLQAPPGAGKTTRVPLALLEAGAAGRIVMLEPRRLAARAAAERMAASSGEPVGATVGYRMRGASKVGPATRIEVVTEGILTRWLMADPELPGIGTVIFDEFHERSLNADLGLALCLEVRGALREDLNLLVMSATLDAEPVAALMGGAPVVTSAGRAFPVEARYLERPLPRGARFAPAVADLVLQGLEEAEGSALVFLPGEGEIRQVAGLLRDRVGRDVVVRPLFGAMKLSEQRAAIAPAPEGQRKVVLATAIAETSLTIEDVRIVVDGGRARRARFDPGSGMSRLVTEPVSRAEAAQRQGRAGRVAPGVCYKLWTRGAEGAFAAYAPPEIAVADLSGLALDLAVWGTGPEDLALLTPPPEGAWAEARALCAMLGALDAEGRVTDHGRALARMPIHPRLAHMLHVAGRQGTELAALLSERDLDRGAGVDLARRVAILRGDAPAPDPGARARVREEAKRLARNLPERAALSLGAQAALAYPDRIGLRRAGEAPRYLLAGGKGAVMEPDAPLAGMRLIVATDLDGDPREARIRQAVAVTEGEVRALFADRILWRDLCAWSKRFRKVVARQQECLGALVLADRIWRDVPETARAAAALEGVRDLGLVALGGGPAFERLRARVALCRAGGLEVPDMSEAALLEAGEAWLLPVLGQVRDADDLRRIDPLEPLRAWLGWDALQAVEAQAPGAITTPLGRKLPVDYSGEVPEVQARVQEFFGVTRHPTVGPGRVPLRLTLLSPGQKPVAVTSDLPGFWVGGYADLRKDMRGRYPRHPWPEDPTEAAPTTRAKPRKG